ncbi:uncharacterized protein N7506_008134 [Penicillium brevicompactum]|uniref:uncharacterized protein n=1 Tax=Penicillium brevicompactum TaxID=5074 RepID=UPI0025402F3C|nr:uncharacterized protein N7506_008134 [Penicillium brevicompactum]KAJ5334351.1 hypothetical protein N7506_008134 [Penicillium brevicompactum]
MSSEIRHINYDPSSPHRPSSEQSQRGVSHEQNIQQGQTQRQHPTSNKTGHSKSDLPLIGWDQITSVASLRKLDRNVVGKAAIRVNLAIQSNGNRLTQQAMFAALNLRLNSLFSRELANRQWQFAYRAIFKAKLLDQDVTNTTLILSVKDNVKTLLDLALEDCYGSFQKAWAALDRRTKASVWQRLAIWMLQNSPEKVLDYLIVTTDSSLDCPDFNMVSDCFLYLEKFYYDGWLRDWSSGKHTYATAVEACMSPKTWPIVNPPHAGFRLFINRAELNGVLEAYRRIKEFNVRMKPETVLCFMKRFTEFRKVEHALEALEWVSQIKDPDFDMASQGVLRHCCKLLTLDTVEDKAGSRNFRILPQLLKMGVQPDRDMMNVVLANAYDTGDPQLGEDMLQFMQSHNHKLDSYTYVTLLTDAVARGDQARVDDLTREVEMQEALKRNPHVFSKIFHAHFTFTAKHLDPETDPAGVFYSMLEMYNKLHDISPLKDLLIIPTHYTPPSTGLEIKTPPSPVALYLMIATFFRCKNRNYPVNRIYDQFRAMVMKGHPSIAPLVESDHIYNEFLIALRKNPHTLPASVAIVQDMLDSSSLPTQTSDGKKLTPVAPSSRTWTILLSSFVFHRQPDAAEKVKEMMAKYNAKFTQVTWNTIINGFANNQQIQDAALAIRHMEAQGFSIDEYTMKGLRYLRDPERLWNSIEEMDQIYGPDGHRASHATKPGSEVHKGEQERDDLIDSGLQKLELKSKTQ